MLRFDILQLVLSLRISTLRKKGLDQAEQICTLFTHVYIDVGSLGKGVLANGNAVH